MEFSFTNAEEPPFPSMDFTEFDTYSEHSQATGDNSANETDAAKALVRDDDFYYEDVIFLVEGYLFKVPRQHFVQESETLREMFSLPQPDSSTVDGLTDEQPLRLDHVQKEDFRQLLKVLYPRKFREEEDLTLDQWTSVLKLADMWDMDKIRKLGVSKMTPLLNGKPAHQIALARTYHVDEWLLPAFERLVYRDTPMNTSDVEELGMGSVLKIAAIREAFKWTVTTYGNNYNYQSNPNSSWTLESARGAVPAGNSQAVLTTRLREAFGQKFDQVL